MSIHDQILGEAFFRNKKKGNDRFAYNPKAVKQPSILPNFNLDTKELGNKLVQTLGAAVGSSNVKSLAGNAIKKFPIIISEHLQPETSVFFKKYFEEQYADHIALMVSNQMINVADYTAGSNSGNIALQAIDNITGYDFSKNRVAVQAAQGKLTIDDIFRNQPLYSLIRNESYKSGDETIDRLLEGAIIVDSKYEDNLLEALQVVDFDEVKAIQEAFLQEARAEASGANAFKDAEVMDTASTDAIKKIADKTIGEVIFGDKENVIKRNFAIATYLLQNRQITGIEYIDYLSQRLGIPCPRHVANEITTYYTASGLEFGYGILQSTSAHDKLTNRIKEYDVLHGTGIDFDFELDTRLRKALSRLTSVTVGTLTAAAGIATTGATTAVISGIGAAAGAGSAVGGAGLGVGGALGKLSSFLITPVLGASVTPLALVLGATAGLVTWALLRRYNQARKNRRLAANQSKIQGWERVEMLVDQYQANREAVFSKYKLKESDFEAAERKFEKAYTAKNSDELDDEDADALAAIKTSSFIEKLQGSLDKVNGVENPAVLLNSSYDVESESANRYNMEVMYEALRLVERDNAARAIVEGIEYENAKFVRTDDLSYAELEKILNEALINTTFAVSSAPKMKTKHVDDYDFALPSFAKADTVAYGSVEYDQRALKDRRYNAPLMMKITFKERYSDGKVSDNELTAVIGILGVVNRVSSEELKSVLYANASGNTINSIFKTQGVVKDTIDSLFTGFVPTTNKVAGDTKLWDNLEKISRLAKINAVTGKKAGNVANAHIVFSRSEVDDVFRESDKKIDYIRTPKLATALMRRYSAMLVMIADDITEAVYTVDDVEQTSWNPEPYSAYRPKDTSSQLDALASRLGR